MGRNTGAGASAAIVVTGTGLLAAAAAGLPWRWATAVLVSGLAALALAVLRGGRGGLTVPALGILGLSACAMVPGGRLGPLGALAVAVATVAFQTGLEARTTGLPRGGVRGEALTGVIVAAGAAALLGLPAVTAPWALPLGLAAAVLALALALSGTGRRQRP
ncbi:hypothetical protein [Streptomyces sp. NPDC047028]|uniref:hypothetical protein n=1 Tax=Streptomyces sp. NPDC047028 TaxID=3155793 RepID=UPI0033FE1E5B